MHIVRLLNTILDLVKYWYFGGCLFFLALGPRPHMSALGPLSFGPSAHGSVKFISAGFDFLPVCVTKCSCGTLIKHISEFSIHKRFYKKFLQINCMNKCNDVPKKIIVVSRNNKLWQDTVIVCEKADEWYIEWQRVTTNDNKWQQVTMSGSEWQWYNSWKRHSTLQRVGDCHTFCDKNRCTTSRDGWL